MNKQINNGIAVYPVNKWVNLWVEKMGRKIFHGEYQHKPRKTP